MTLPLYLRRRAPEACLLAGAIAMTTGGPVNPLFIAVAIILGIQVVAQFKALGILTGIGTAFLSLFMMMAVIAEYREFTTVTSEANLLLVSGLGIALSLLLLAVWVLVRYLYRRVPSL